MVTSVPICAGCSRFRDGSCAAYPDGIPAAVLYHGADHRLPLPGDQGIRFVPSSPEALALVEAVHGTDPVTFTGSWPGNDPHRLS